MHDKTELGIKTMRVNYSMEFLFRLPFQEMFCFRPLYRPPFFSRLFTMKRKNHLRMEQLKMDKSVIMNEKNIDNLLAKVS